MRASSGALGIALNGKRSVEDGAHGSMMPVDYPEHLLASAGATVRRGRRLRLVAYRASDPSLGSVFIVKTGKHRIP